MKSPQASFVVPCYNYGCFLGDCLRSILNQTGVSDFEVIVLNDASTDDTAEVIASIKDDRLKIIEHRTNRGHVYTINEGLRAARGEWVARIDADDRYLPDFLRESLKAGNSSPQIGAVFSDVRMIDGTGAVTEPWVRVRPKEREGAANRFVVLLTDNFICAPTLLARREAWEKALPILDGLTHSDWYLNLQIARRYPLYYVNKPLADYRVHGQNHHVRIMKDRSEEPSTIRILDLMYGEKEADPELERAKRAAKGAVYAAQYSNLGRRYYASGWDADARRCLWKSFRYSPFPVLSSSHVPIIAPLLVGRRPYRAVRELFRRRNSR